MITEGNRSTETRIRDNRRFASLLRQRLKGRQGNGELPEMIWRLMDDESIERCLRNERQGRKHVAKRLSENGTSE